MRITNEKPRQSGMGNRSQVADEKLKLGDEGKPRCEACEIKGFSCKYGADLTFIRSSNPGRLQADSEPNGSVRPYTTVQVRLHISARGNPGIQSAYPDGRVVRC